MWMNRIIVVIFFPLLIFSTLRSAYSQHSPYLWLDFYDPEETIEKRISVPEGYSRVQVQPGSYQDWLRKLPLKKGRPPVYLYNGNKKRNQGVHIAVVDIDIGESDLQQCADAVIRLRAEYLYWRGRYGDIRFRFTSGDRAEFSQWIRGYRPVVKRNQVQWVRSGSRDSNHSQLRSYLNTVFLYAGSHSLSKELRFVADRDDMIIGDVFIQGGFPGHAVIIVDMAENTKTGEKIFLLAQSYMPAQNIHVLSTPRSFGFTVMRKILETISSMTGRPDDSYPTIKAWYKLADSDRLHTPQWTFEWGDLRRF